MSKRDDILQAALIEFGNHDFDTASVNQIIKDANSSKGNFYHYFHNKEDLYLVLLKEAWGKKAQYMNVPYDNDIFQFLEKQVMSGIHFSKENPEFYQLSRQFAKEPNKDIYQRVLLEIAKETEMSSAKNEINQKMTQIKKTNTIREELPEDLVEQYIQFILKYMNEFIGDEENLEVIEKKLGFVIDVLKFGLLG